MKKLLFLISFICVCYTLTAQNYYKDVKQVTTDEVTFNVEMSNYSFMLSNATNVNDNRDWVYLDGSPLLTIEESDAITAKFVTKNMLFRAFKETFTEQEYAELMEIKECALNILYVIDNNGNVTEVAFILSAVPRLLSFPPSKYALLEKNIKQYVKWTLNDAAKKLQFMHGLSFVDFSKNPMPNFPEIQPGLKLDSMDKPLIVPEK